MKGEALTKVIMRVNGIG